jgi:hypothetical protein
MSSKTAGERIAEGREVTWTIRKDKDGFYWVEKPGEQPRLSATQQQAAKVRELLARQDKEDKEQCDGE